MWFLKNSGWLLIFIVAGLFGYQNRNETVSAVHLAGRNYTLQPLIIVVFVAFVIGMFCAFVLTLFQQIRIQSAIGRISRENQELRRELSQLRNLPLDDLKVGEPSGAGRG